MSPPVEQEHDPVCIVQILEPWKPAVTPSVAPREMEVELAYVNGSLGLSLDASQMARHLSRMALQVLFYFCRI